MVQLSHGILQRDKTHKLFDDIRLISREIVLLFISFLPTLIEILTFCRARERDPIIIL